MSMFQLGAITLANYWKSLLHPEILALEFPPVESVDCSDCRMVNAKLFPPHVKCCTYTPELPNFQIGALLEHGASDHGMSIVRSWLDVGRGTPLYLCVPPYIKRNERNHHAFEEWPQCPLFLDGGCSIYAYRPYICAGYHCFYPDPIELYCFWNSLSSLMALSSAVGSQFLAVKHGLDPEQFGQTWATVSNEDDIWTEEDGIEANFSKQLWQDLGDTDTFYKNCYRYIVEHPETVLREIDQFRRDQLIRYGKQDGTWSTARQQEIESQPFTPVAVEPPAHVHKLLSQKLVLNFAQNQWTFYEQASYTLWYYEKVWGPLADNPIYKTKLALTQQAPTSAR